MSRMDQQQRKAAMKKAYENQPVNEPKLLTKSILLVLWREYGWRSTFTVHTFNERY